MPVELLTLRPTGCDPAEITRPAGRFILAILNRSGLDEVQFRLDKETNSRLNNVNVSSRQLNWAEAIDLPPGKYKLTGTAHPEFSFTLNLMP